MTRTMLSDEQWAQIQPHLPPERGHHGRPYSRDHRTTVEGILWIARTGAPWRDLPERYGKWNSVYRRFRRWSDRGVFAKVMSTLGDGVEVAMVDGTYVKAHQHAAGALKGEARPTTPELSRRWGEAEAGSHRRSPRSPMRKGGSSGSR